MAGSTVRSVRVLLSASTAGYIAEMKRAGAATESVAASMTASGAKASAAQKSWALAAKATKVAAIGVAGGLVIAGKAAADYQAEMALVRTLSHATTPEMRKLDDQARHMGQSWGFTAVQVAQGQEELVKAGVSLKDILGGGLRGTLALAAAGQTDVATATQYAASAMTQFRLKGTAVPHIADLLAAGADKALGSVTDLGYALSQAGTTAHQSGISINQTVGVLSAFAQAGLQGERGGTVFKQMLLQLQSPADANLKLMDKYGLSLYKANGQIKTMPQLAEDLRQSFDHLTPAVRNAALGQIFGSRAIQGANILMAEGGAGIRRWIHNVNDQGFAAQQAAGKLDSLKGDWQKLKSVAQTGLIDLGSGEQNPLRHLVQNVTSDIKRLERDGTLKRWGAEVGRTLDEVITKAGPLAHDVGHALSVVGRGIGTIVSGFNKLPDGVQQALVTGGVVAYGAKKLGLLSAVKAATGGAVGGGLVGRVGVVPVAVTNWPPGFVAGGPGGKLGAAEGAAAGAAARGATGIGEKFAGEAALAKLMRGGFVRNLGVGAFVLGDAGNEVLPGPPKGTRFFDPNSIRGQQILNAADVEKTNDALAKLGLTQRMVAQAAAGNAKAQAEVDTAMAKARDQVESLNKAQQRNRATNGSLDEYTRRKHAIDDLVGAYNAAQGAIQKTASEQSRADGVFVASKHDLAEYNAAMRSLPKKVQTLVRTPGAIESMSDVKRLQRQYNLTPKQIRTLVQLAGVSQAAAQARAYAAQLAALNGRVATTYLRQVTEHVIAGGGRPVAVRGQADGGEVLGQRHPYGDKVLIAAAPGEEIITNRHGEADQFRRDRATGRIPAYANGGAVPGFANGGTTSYSTGNVLVTVPIAKAANGWILSARNVAVAQAIARAAHDVTDAYYDELKAARQTKVSRVDELHTLQSIRDTQKELSGHHKKGKHKGEHTLTGLDRRAAQAELADYRKQLHDIRNARAEAIKQAKDDIRAATLQEQAQNRKDAIDSLTGSLDLLGETTSATRAVSLVNRQVADIGQYGQIVAQLRSKGANPLLLQQLQNHAMQGDFRSAIRLGQALLAQPTLLTQLSAAYASLNTVSGSVATFTTDPRFLGGGKWNPTGVAPKVVQVALTADPTSWMRELQRVVTHEVQAALAKVT